MYRWEFKYSPGRGVPGGMSTFNSNRGAANNFRDVAAIPIGLILCIVSCFMSLLLLGLLAAVIAYYVFGIIFLAQDYTVSCQFNSIYLLP